MPFPRRPLALLVCTVLTVAALANYPRPSPQQGCRSYPNGLDTGP